MVNNNLNNKSILVVGLPRSGTTWQFNILSQAKEVLPIFEPDNRPINPYSYYYLGSNHRFPINEGNNETNMLAFWNKIFEGGWKEGFTFKLLKYIYLSNIKVIENQIYEYSNFIIPPNKYINYFPKDQYIEFFTDKIVIGTVEKLIGSRKSESRALIKSVHAVRQLEWLKNNFNPQFVILVRKLRNMIASFLRLRLADALRGIDASPFYKNEVNNYYNKAKDDEIKIFHKIVIQACELTTQLLNFNHKYSDTILVKHEEACLNPKQHYMNLYKMLNLKWNKTVENFIKNENKEGSAFKPQRLAKDEQIRYKDQLSKEYLEIINNYANIYDLAEYY